MVKVENQTSFIFPVHCSTLDISETVIVLSFISVDLRIFAQVTAGV